jgi:hypothetical protein
MLRAHHDYPIRPKKQKGESLVGYVYRFQNENGYTMSIPLYEVLRKLYSGQYEEAATNAFESLQDMVGSSTVLDRTWWFGQLKEESRFAENPKIWAMRNFKPVHFCPVCIRKYGFHFAFWEVPWVSVCPIHKIKLIDTCSACHKALSWTGMTNNWHCSCGQAIQTLAVVPASPSTVVAASLLAGAEEVELPVDFQGDREQVLDKYSLKDVYIGFEWTHKLWDIVTASVSKIDDEPECSRKRSTIRALPNAWEARLLSSSPQQLLNRQLRFLKNTVRHNWFMLCFIPDYRKLSQIIAFSSSPENSVLLKKFKEGVNYIIQEYSANLPISSMVFYQPSYPKESCMICLMTFMNWWYVLTDYLGELDPEIENYQRDFAASVKISWDSEQDIKIVTILNFLIDAASREIDAKEFRLFIYWWRIPHGLRNITDPSELISRLSGYFSGLLSYELDFLVALVRTDWERARWSWKK